MLQCVAVCCSVLQCAACVVVCCVYSSVLWRQPQQRAVRHYPARRAFIVANCSVLKYVAVRYSMLQGHLQQRAAHHYLEHPTPLSATLPRWSSAEGHGHLAHTQPSEVTCLYMYIYVSEVTCVHMCIYVNHIHMCTYFMWTYIHGRLAHTQPSEATCVCECIYIYIYICIYVNHMCVHIVCGHINTAA